MIPRRIWIGLLLLLTLTAWLPLLGLLVSSGLARALGCRVDESGPRPCAVGGVDLGPALAAGFVGGWLLLATWPLMIVTAAAWAALSLAAIVRRARSSRRSP